MVAATMVACLGRSQVKELIMMKSEDSRGGGLYGS